MPYESDDETGVPLNELMQGADGEAERFFVIEEPQKPKRKPKPSGSKRGIITILLILVAAQAAIIAFLVLQPSEPIPLQEPEIIVDSISVAASVVPSGTSFSVSTHLSNNPATPKEKPILLMAKTLDANGCPLDLTTEFKTTDKVYVTYQSPVQNQQSFWVQLSTTKSGTLFEEVYRLFPYIIAPQTYANACISVEFEGSQLAALYGLGTYKAGIYQSDNPLGNVDFTLSN